MTASLLLTSHDTLLIAVVEMVQAVLLALVALYAARSHVETKRLNGHAEQLLAARLHDEARRQ